MKPSFFTAILLAAFALFSRAAEIFPVTYEGYIPSYASEGDVLTIDTISGPNYGTLVWATGGSPTPSADIVTTIDTTADLINATANVVLTLGYYTAGDGGGAAYQLDTGSVAATNTVTVFEAPVGRYILLQNGAISAKQAGAKGDSTDGTDGTDDHDALQALLDACVGGVARINPATYRSAGGLASPDDVKIIGRDAWVTLQTTGEPGLLMGSRCTVDGGRWTGARQSGGANGYDNSTIAFGVYDSAGSVSNCVVKNVRLEMTGYAACAVFITGASHNIDIENIEFGDSSTIESVVAIHWGHVSGGNPTNGTLHPHNIRVKNVSIGSISGSAEASAVFTSAAYSVSFENISSQSAKYAAVVVAGDYGYKYSGFSSQTLGSVSMKNVSCLNAYSIGMLVQNEGVSSIQYPQKNVIENCTILGPNDGSGNAGIYFLGANNTIIKDSVFAGHYQGTIFTASSKNITFDNCIFATNSLAGIIVDNAGTTGIDILNSSFLQNGRGVSSTNAAGIKLVAGSNVRISGCKFGSATTDANQEIGVSVLEAFVGAVITDNYVNSVKGSLPGFNLGFTTSAGNVALFSNNRVASGITLYTGPDIVPYAFRGVQRTFAGTATPTIGTYVVGDMVVFNTATATPFAKVCSVAGTPGTWVTAY